MNTHTAAKLLATLGNPTRLKIVRVLYRAGAPGLAVGEIRRRVKIPASTLTHHLTHLKAAGLLRQRRRGATLVCQLQYARFARLLTYLSEECCAEAAGGR